MTRRKSQKRRLKEIEKELAAHYEGPPPWKVEGKSSEQWASERLAEAAKKQGPPPWEVEGKSIEEWVLEQKAREEELARPFQNERGRYLDAMTTIDWHIGSLMADHFGAAGDRVNDFLEWMASSVSFADKADIVGVIVESRDLEDNFGDLSKALKKANDVRNVLAHAILEPGEHWCMFVMRSRSGELRFHKYTLDEMKTNVRRAYSLNYQILHLQGVINGEWSDDYENPFEDAGSF
jgi:hypothetical protein